MPSTIQRLTMDQALAQQREDLGLFLGVAASVAKYARAEQRVPDELRHNLHASYMNFHCSSLIVEDLESRAHSVEVTLVD